MLQRREAELAEENRRLAEEKEASEAAAKLTTKADADDAEIMKHSAEAATADAAPAAHQAQRREAGRRSGAPARAETFG